MLTIKTQVARCTREMILITTVSQTWNVAVGVNLLELGWNREWGWMKHALGQGTATKISSS